ncbi:MAG: hypothetical protein ACFFAQ_16530 [Promethearchaeota archaeon]
MGLNKKDINQILIFERKNSILYSSLLILALFIALVGFFFFINVIFGFWASSGSTSDSNYPSGSLYSTVKTRDFKNKR